MRKAVFVLPYFGPLLHWTELFLLTAGRNPDFRFVIYTDQPFDHFERYENIDWRPSKLEDMRDRAIQATGLKIPEMKGAYKLCDFRPAFGEMFPDEIKEPFWGHIDLDMIWGRLDRFYTPKMFAKYDVISGDHKSLCGPFTLFRNSPKINRLYTEAPEFEETFLDREHRTFDEHAMKRLVFSHPNVRLKTRGRQTPGPADAEPTIIATAWCSSTGSPTTSDMPACRLGMSSFPGFTWRNGKRSLTTSIRKKSGAGLWAKLSPLWISKRERP